MKKVIAILLTLSLLFTLTACGGSSTSSTTEAEPAQTETTPESTAETTPEATPEASTETVQEAATEAVSEAAAEAAAETAPEAATEAAAEAATEAAPEAATEAAAEAATEAAAETADAAAEAVNAAGGYKLTSLTTGSGSNLEFINIAMDLGANTYIFLTEDSTGHLDFLEAKMPLEWDDSNIKIPAEAVEAAQDALTVPYTCADDTLQISTQAYSMEFTRMSDEDMADYEANGSGSLSGIVGPLIQGLIDNLDGDLLSVLFSGLGEGLFGDDREPIPEGDLSTEPASAAIDSREFTIVGTDHVQGEDSEIIVFYYDVTNNSDELRHAWDYNYDASQGGSFLKDVYSVDGIPECSYDNYEVVPGKTIRVASAYKFDPNGGVVSFRISSGADDNTLLYYVDPANLSGAPEPFAFDADPSISEYLEGYPEETEDLKIDRYEFYKDEEGNDALRVYITFRNSSEETLQMGDVYGCMAIQDGVEVDTIWAEDVEETSTHLKDVAPGEEILNARSYELRTGSPVVFVSYTYNEDYTVITPVLTKTIEIQ